MIFFPVLLSGFTTVQKLYSSTAHIFPALGAPRRSHEESLLVFVSGPPSPWKCRFEVGSCSRDREMPHPCFLLQLSGGCEQAPQLVPWVLGIAKSNSLGVTKEVSVLQKAIDLALGKCCFLTGSVSRDSSCGRKDAHPVFPGLELVFFALPCPIVFC